MFYNIKGFRANKTHKIVLKLLKGNQLDNENNAAGRTLVGEFFNIDEYLLFIIRNKRLIINEISNHFGEGIQFEVWKVPFSQIKSETNAVFIVPILDNKIKINGRVISHWVSLKFIKRNNKYKVMNSQSRVIKSYTLDEIQEKHFNLEDGSFYWDRYERKRYIPVLNGIEKFVRSQMKKKYDFIKNGILHNKINYTTGQIIMIRKL